MSSYEHQIAEESLNKLSVYNMNIMDPKIRGADEISARAAAAINLHSMPGGGSRPVSAKTNFNKLGRPSSGKRTRPFSGNQLARNGTQALPSNAELVLSGFPASHISGFDDLPPGDSCLGGRRMDNSNELYQQTVDEYISSHNAASHDSLRAPRSTPEPNDHDSRFNQLEQSSHFSSQSKTLIHEKPSQQQSAFATDHFDQSDDELVNSKPVQRHVLNLALPDMNDSADEDDEEIPTLRLLDDLHINLSHGTASVTITPELKAKLAADKSSSIKHRLSFSDDSDGADGVPDDTYRRDMEKEIKSLLSRNSQISSTVSKVIEDSPLRQSIPCWDGPSVEGNLVTEVQTTSKGEKSGDCQSPVSRAPAVTLINGSQSKACEDLVREESSASSADEEDSQIAEDDVAADDMHAVQPEEEDREERLLYKWDINIGSTSTKAPSLEVPLIHRRRDYDAIDDEIDQRVDQIQKELAHQILQSQIAIEKLESQALDTEFRIPEFCELDQKSVLSPAHAPSENEADNVEGKFTLQRQDFNVLQQAKKLGLKNRDVSSVFTAVTPRYRKKYKPTGTGKVNVANVTSRINSGVKSRKNGVTKASSKGSADSVADDSKSSQLYLSGNAHVEVNQITGQDKDSKATTEAKKSRTVTFHGSIGKDEAVPVKKVVKTFSFSDSGEVTENKEVSSFISQKSTHNRYKMPVEAKVHLERCAKRPPTVPQSTSRKLAKESTQTPSTNKNPEMIISNSQSTNRRPETAKIHNHDSKRGQIRVQSAPAVRKLNRERSTERKLSNGFINVCPDISKNDDVITKEDTGLTPAEKSLSTTVGRLKYRTGNEDSIVTAMTLCGDGDEDNITDVDSFNLNSQTGINYQQGGLAGGTTPNRATSAHHHTANTKKSVDRKPRRVQSAPVRRRVSRATPNVITHRTHIEREDPDEIEEIVQLCDKVAELGVELDRSTLDRALLPPAKQSVQMCQKEIGRRFHTAGLLSSPEKWLKEEYKKLREAKRQVKLFEQQMRKEGKTPKSG